MIKLLVVVVLAIGVCVYRKLHRKKIEDWDVPEEVLARQIPSEFPAYKRLFKMQDELSYFIPFRHN